jgi:hypothetical protein
MEISGKGWVRVAADASFWIPCPAAFPPGIDRESWAREGARVWWEASGLTYPDSAVDQLAQMLTFIQERAYAKVACHQIWIYLRDPAMPPLPVHIGIWKSKGERELRLRELTGADDKASLRKPDVSETETENLGRGLRVLRYRNTPKGRLMGILMYGFRSQEFETDVQIFTESGDVRQLTAAHGDIDDFVQGVSVYSNTSRPQDG